LLIEDNLAIARQLTEFLEGHGWRVDYAATGNQGTVLADQHIYDVVLLDLNLPDIDGLQVCDAIKQRAEVTPPVLMLTARDAFEDKARGFERGADDYMTKPFDLRELALRCRALAKRHELHQSKVLRIGDLEVDLARKMARRSGAALNLTAIGFRILALLARAYPNPLSRSALLHTLWGEDPPDSDALKSHIYSLRTALDKPFSHPMLKTITNVGYRLETTDESE
jgi:DNA-binding response OmpR family regulator